jgi:hypothetical protein
VISFSIVNATKSLKQHNKESISVIDFSIVVINQFYNSNLMKIKPLVPVQYTLKRSHLLTACFHFDP